MRPSAQIQAVLATALHPVLGNHISDGTADVSSYPIPGLPDDAVWRVLITDMDHSQQTYVGFWADGTGRELVDDQPAFFELVRSRGGAQLPDEGTALGYVLAFLEVTRGPSVLVRPIHASTDIPWRPGTADEEARRAALLANSPIRPPTAEPTNDGFRVEMWLVVDQRIQLNSFDVARDGTLTAEFRVVATDLPLPIVR